MDKVQSVYIIYTLFIFRFIFFKIRELFRVERGDSSRLFNFKKIVIVKKKIFENSLYIFEQIK